MSSIAKGIRLSSPNARSMVVSGLIVLLVVAMFFIPEIIGIGLQQNLTTPETKTSKLPRQKAHVTAPPAEQEVKITEPVKHHKSPLDSVVALLDSARSSLTGKKDEDEEVTDGESKKKIGKSEKSAENDDEGVSPKDKTHKTKQAKKDEELGEGPISWKVLKSKSTRKEMDRAQQDALKLASDIPDKFQASKYALYNFSSGVRMISKGVSKNMSAEEAFQYIERLDSNVTGALKGDMVDSTIINQWTDISLGPVFEKSRAYQEKMASRMPFDPKLRLLSVKVRQQPDHYGRFIENGKAYVSFKAGVVGRDVKRVSIYRNGVHIIERHPRGKRYSAYRIFTLLNREARGLYTIRVYDTRNRFVEKSYNFYVPARKFAWMRKAKGAFNIPFGEMDPRLDRLFLYRNYGAAQPLTYFTKDSGGGANTF